jgi:hypothetical protein
MVTVRFRLREETLGLLKDMAMGKRLTLSQVLRGVVEGWARGKIQKLRVKETP